MLTAIDGHALGGNHQGRRPLPQLEFDRLFVTDGGIETDLIFHHGIELPYFAAFPLLEDADHRISLCRYWDEYVVIARELGAGLVIDTPTWRANPDWAARLGYSPERLDAVNRAAVDFAEEIRATATADGVTAVVSGCIGPRGDGYKPGELMTAEQAESYHAVQVRSFAATTADQVAAMTITNAEEAIGIVRAAVAVGIPVVISFTVETDGLLPTGQSLAGAIEQVDEATAGAAAYFMVNCAHPSHFGIALDEGGPWCERLLGVRANASTRSHAELDEANELDEGDPKELAAQHVALRHKLPAVTVLGGCCGTDARHVAAICAAWVAGD